jgi:uncharacterized protein (TIGR00369 family)
MLMLAGPMTHPSTPPGLERLRMLRTIQIHPPPVVAFLGLELVEVGEGAATFEMQAQPHHHNPMGTVHGGILCDLGDAAMGTAMGTTVEDGETFTTIELKANFFKPVREGRLRAEARVVKRSRSIGYLECNVTDASGSLVCRLGSTCMMLRGEAAKGR